MAKYLKITSNAVFDPSAYIPDSIYPYYENVKDTFVGLLETFGIAKAIDDAGPGILSSALFAFPEYSLTG